MQNIENCFYRVSTKALIYNEKWEFLLCKEKNWLWDLPWGWLDHWENVYDSIKRELKEEMWLNVTKISNNPKYFITAHKKESKTRPWIANVCYEVEVENLNFNPTEECIEIWFFSPETIKDIDVIINIKELCSQISKNNILKD